MSDAALRSDASRRAMSHAGAKPARRYDDARRGEELCDAQNSPAIPFQVFRKRKSRGGRQPTVNVNFKKIFLVCCRPKKRECAVPQSATPSGKLERLVGLKMWLV